MDNENEIVSIEEIEKMAANNNNIMPHKNRAERRAIAKKLGKKGRENLNYISEITKKLNYINLIEGIKKLNEKNKELEKNEDTNKAD